jgi:hypothetical protein
MIVLHLRPGIPHGRFEPVIVKNSFGSRDHLGFVTDTTCRHDDCITAHSLPGHGERLPDIVTDECLCFHFFDLSARAQAVANFSAVSINDYRAS